MKASEELAWLFGARCRSCGFVVPLQRDWRNIGIGGRELICASCYAMLMWVVTKKGVRMWLKI